MNHSMPGLPIHHHLPEFTQTQHPSSQWCHPAILSSVVLFSSCPQSLPASESFPMSQLFAWGGQSTGVSAFHYRGLECKIRKSRNTWSNRQIWPWNVEWSRAKTNRVLPRKFTDHCQHPLPTTQEKTLHMEITRWSVKKAECQRIDAFELWCWRRLLRVPGLKGDTISPFWRRSTLGFLWKEWC